MKPAELPQLLCRRVPRPRRASDPFAAAQWHELADAITGAEPRLATRVAACHDGVTLWVLFDAEDDHTVATMTGHDDPLWQEDAVEAFLAPQALERYIELETNPRAAVFDAMVTSPQRSRAGMRVDTAWDAAGLEVTSRVVGSAPSWRWQATFALPFAAPEYPTPRPGDTWRVNFFRIDRHPHEGDSYQAWSPPLRSPADFHVPDRFGTLWFE